MQAQIKAALVFTLLLSSSLASADPHAKAEALFRQGRDLMAAKKYPDACAAFDASQKLDPATTTLFNQADCREKNGQLATAWGLFVEAERQTRAAGDVSERLHQVAQQRVTKLTPRLSKLTVHVATPPAGLTITRNGEPVERAEWNQELPIDGGAYQLSARLGDREVWSQSIMMAAEGGKKVVDVVVPELPASAAITQVPVTGSPAGITQPAPHATQSRRGAKIATAGAAIFLGGALGFELLGRSTYNQAKADNDIGLWNTANKQRYVGEAFLAGGLATAGVAIYLWLRDDGGETRRVARVAPVVDGNSAGLVLAGRW